MTSSQTVSPAGGSVSTTLGTQTVKVIVPPGALSGPATVSVTVYSGSASPQALQSSGRKVQTIGSGAALVAAFSVAVSGATLIKPLQASLTTTAPTAGSIFRLAGYGTSFDDVDTVTYGNGTATSDLNVAYPRMSLATPPGGTLYAFYTEPASSAGAAPAPVVTVAPSTTVGIFGTATFTATETSPNGFPYLDPNFTFALSNASSGTINATTGAFTAGAIDAGGTVTATDNTAARGNPHGSATISVTSQRPGNAGDAFSFTGTLKSTTALVNRNPTAPQTDAATVALTSTVGSFTAAGGGGQNAVQSTETDTYPLQTITTATKSAYVYTPSGTTATVAIKSSDAKDSNNSEYVTTYGTGNGLLDVIPEATGAFGPNNAALTYVETDPANFGRSRTVAANGTYVEKDTDAFGDVQTITTNADLSASLDARQYSGYRFTLSAPSAGSPSTITIKVFNASNTQIANIVVPSWIPAGTTQPSTETDVDNGSVSYPAACAVPSKYGTAGRQIVQTINRVDTALGNLEVQTTTTYVAPQYGPVCIQMTDFVKTFYDYTLQDGSALLAGGGTTDLEETTISETLTLQSASTESGTHTTAVKRGTSALPSGTAVISSSAFAPVAFARARFDHAVREKLDATRKQTFNHNFGSNGVKSL